MKKTLLLVTILLSLFTQGMKADEYTTVLEDMLRQGVVAGMDVSSFDQMKSVSPKMAEYFQGQFITDMTEIMVPFYRNNCTIDEMKQMKDYLSSAEMKALVKKMYESANNQEDLQKQMGPIMQSIMMGGTPADVKVSECSKELGDAIDKLYEVMEMDKFSKGIGEATMNMMSKSMKEMITKMASQFGGETSASEIDQMWAQMEGPMKSAGEYLSKNMPTIIRNAYIKSLSVEDINQLTKIQDQPFYPAYKRVLAAMYEDMPNTSDKMMNLIMPKVTEAMGEIGKSVTE